MITKIKVIIIFLLNLFNYSETNIKDFKILDYETEYVFAENYAEDEEFIISKGEKGYSYIENDQEVTKEPVKEVVKKGTRTNNDFSGTLTGYGPDCKGCSKIGTVACSTKDNKNWSLINDGIIYEDEDYGSVNIVASDHLLFSGPCVRKDDLGKRRGWQIYRCCHRVYFQLCLLLLGNLPRRHSGRPQGAARSRSGARHDERADLLSGHVTPDGEKDRAADE